jgi:hypothetical protein
MQKGYLLHTVSAFFGKKLLGLGACLVLAGAVHAQTTCLSITSYGGNGNGTTDNTTPFNSALAALTAHGGCISFPAGKYLFNSAVTVTYPTGYYSLTLVGAGSDNTTLYFPASNGITINAQNTGSQALQSIHVRDFTFTTGHAGTYAALTFTKSGSTQPFAQSEVERSVFRGDDGATQTDYWGVGINVSALPNINFDGDLFYGNSASSGGTGIVLGGTSTSVGTAYNIAKSGFYSLGIGVAIESNVQAVTMTQTNIVNGLTCLWVPSGVTGVSGLMLTGGNNFNCQGTQILLQSPVSNFVMNGNLIFIGANGANNVGVWVDAVGSQNYSIVNNIFGSLAIACTTCYGPSGYAILVNNAGSGSVKDGIVLGNTFSYMAVGVDLTNASNWNVQANYYYNNTVQVSNPTAGSMNSVGVATK